VVNETRTAEISAVDEEVIQVQLQKTVNSSKEVSDYVPYGLDCLPEKGAKVVLFSLGSKLYQLMMGVKRKVTDRIAKPGETRLYSKTGSQVYLDKDDNIIIKNSGGGIIKVNSDNEIELNGNSKSSVTFDDLKIVYDLLIIHIDGHVHTETGGTTSVPTVQTPPGADSIDSAKNDKVLM